MITRDREPRTRSLRQRDAALQARSSSAQESAAQSGQFKLIEHSHQRCEALGLSRIERQDFSPLLRGDITLARERNQRLFTHAAPVMEMLCEQIAGTESMIVLTDAQGTILHSVGDDDFLARADKVALKPGVSWAEHSKGTNAIGTALFEEAPTLVHANQHFMHANEFLTCSAAPIFDPRGNMLGVLDVSGDHRSYHQHTMGLVRVSARMIENHWLSDDCSHRLRLHFHSRAEFLGTLLEGILVISVEGKILGSNRSALDQLALGAAALRMHTLGSLLGTSVARVMDHFRAPQPAPMFLNLNTGQALYVTARFDWAPRPLFGKPVATDNPAAEPARQAAGGASAAPPSAAPAQAALGLLDLQTGDARLEGVIDKVRKVLNRDIPMLILGETGSGKEVLARAMHRDSNRAGKPFVTLNCAAMAESLIEAALFGDEEGAAFTGARHKAPPGCIAQAQGGTLLLDEIGDLPLAAQARLLRVLQERKLRPPGGQRATEVDVAIIGATHRNLREMIVQQRFREDLYYRLNGLCVRLPALRERSDLDMLAQRILRAECPQGAPAISPTVMALFRRYRWPGNLRQLANVLRIAAVMAAGEGQITPAHLSDDLLEEMREAAALDAASAAPAVTVDAPPVDPARVDPARVVSPGAARAAEADGVAAPLPAGNALLTLKDAELETIRAALAAAGGNISEASKRLGICRNTIYRKLYWKAGR